jgi:hypothetical protein
MDLDFVYASDDSCQVQLYVRGHFDPDEFRSACEKFYLENFEKHLDLNSHEVKQAYWRNVPAPGDCIVGDRQLVESVKGPGAYPVTILAEYLPM